MIYSRSQIGLFQDNFLNCVILWASPNCGTSIGVFKMSILLIIKCIGQVHFFYFLSEVMITLHELNHQNQMVCCRLEYRFLFFFVGAKRVLQAQQNYTQAAGWWPVARKQRKGRRKKPTSSNTINAPSSCKPENRKTVK